VLGPYSETAQIGLSKSSTIRDNLILNKYYKKPYCSFGILNTKS
jgi:hypothetical protein